MEIWLWTRSNLNQVSKPLLRPRQAWIDFLRVSLQLLHFPSNVISYIPFQPSTHFVHMFKTWCENVCNISVWTYGLRKKSGPNNPICNHSIPHANLNIT